MKVHSKICKFWSYGPPLHQIQLLITCHSITIFLYYDLGKKKKNGSASTLVIPSDHDQAWLKISDEFRFKPFCRKPCGQNYVKDIKHREEYRYISYTSRTITHVKIDHREKKILTGYNLIHHVSIVWVWVCGGGRKCCINLHILAA